MEQIIAVIVILAIIIGIIKVGSFLWRLIGIAFALFLIWIYRDDLSNWFNTVTTEGNLQQWLTQAGNFVKQTIHTVGNWFGELL